MAFNQELNLRLHFVKNRKFNKFVSSLKKDDYMSSFVLQILENSVLFQFDSIETRNYCLNLFKQNIDKCVEKRTKFANYLKIY